MTEAKHEIEQKLAAARQELEATLKMREAAEQAVKDAEAALQERREALEAVLKDEGNLRGAIGELKKMREALDVPEGTADG